MLSCPQCHSKQIHRSKRIFDRIVLAAMSIRPYRCDLCDYRFFPQVSRPFRRPPYGTDARSIGFSIEDSADIAGFGFKHLERNHDALNP
jgi:transposase-like protein